MDFKQKPDFRKLVIVLNKLREACGLKSTIRKPF